MTKNKPLIVGWVPTKTLYMLPEEYFPGIKFYKAQFSTNKFIAGTARVIFSCIFADTRTPWMFLWRRKAQKIIGEE